MVTPFDAACLLSFKALLGPSGNRAFFLVVSLLGQLLPACIAYHLVGNNMRVLHVSKIKRPLLFSKLFTELLQFVYCCCSSHVHVDWLASGPAELSPRDCSPGSPRLLSAGSAGPAAIYQVFSPVQYALLPGTFEQIFHSPPVPGLLREQSGGCPQATLPWGTAKGTRGADLAPLSPPLGEDGVAPFLPDLHSRFTHCC